MNLQPLSNRVIIKPLDAVEKLPGGIIIPESAKEKQQKGKIVAVGPGKTTDGGKTIAMFVKVGQTVLFGKYSGNEVEVEGDKLLIMKEDDILSIIDLDKE